MSWLFGRRSSTPTTPASALVFAPPLFSTKQEDDRCIGIMFSACTSTAVSLGGNCPTANVGALAPCVRSREGIITEIYLPKQGVRGPILFAATPRCVVRLILANNLLSGKLDLWDLPLSLKVMDVSSNRFEGSVNLTHLPNGLEELNLSDNLLSGVLELGMLPPHLASLYVQKNRFTHVVTSAPSDVIAAQRVHAVRVAEQEQCDDSAALTLDADGREAITSTVPIVAIHDHEFTDGLRVRELSAPVSAFDPSGDASELLGGGGIASMAWLDMSRLPKALRHLNVEGNDFCAVVPKPQPVPGARVTVWWGPSSAAY